jgi:hypothetical protein
MPTTGDILTAIDDAIFAIVTKRVAEVEVRGQRFRSADLGQLRELRREYQALAHEDGSAPRVVRGPVITPLAR